MAFSGYEAKGVLPAPGVGPQSGLGFSSHQILDPLLENAHTVPLAKLESGNRRNSYSRTEQGKAAKERGTSWLGTKKEVTQGP